MLKISVSENDRWKRNIKKPHKDRKEQESTEAIVKNKWFCVHLT